MKQGFEFIAELMSTCGSNVGIFFISGWFCIIRELLWAKVRMKNPTLILEMISSLAMLTLTIFLVICDVSIFMSFVS